MRVFSDLERELRDSGYCKVDGRTPCDSELRYVYGRIPEEWLDKALERLDEKVTTLYAISLESGSVIYGDPEFDVKANYSDAEERKLGERPFGNAEKRSLKCYYRKDKGKGMKLYFCAHKRTISLHISVTEVVCSVRQHLKVTRKR